MSVHPHAPAGIQHAHRDHEHRDRDAPIRRPRWGIVPNCACIALELTAGFRVDSLLSQRIQRGLRERHGISHATIRAEVAIPRADSPLPIHHNGAKMRR